MAHFNTRKILVYLEIKHKHNWHKIYKHIKDRVPVDLAEIDEFLAKKKINLDEWCTILDKEYPECLKQAPQPIFALKFSSIEYRRYVYIDSMLGSVDLGEHHDTSDSKA